MDAFSTEGGAFSLMIGSVYEICRKVTLNRAKLIPLITILTSGVCRHLKQSFLEINPNSITDQQDGRLNYLSSIIGASTAAHAALHHLDAVSKLVQQICDDIQLCINRRLGCCQTNAERSNPSLNCLTEPNEMGVEKDKKKLDIASAHIAVVSRLRLNLPDVTKLSIVLRSISGLKQSFETIGESMKVIRVLYDHVMEVYSLQEQSSVCVLFFVRICWQSHKKTWCLTCWFGVTPRFAPNSE